MTSATRVQSGFAFYEDGTESGAAIIGSIDNDISRGVDDTFQIRIEVNVTGMAANVQGQLRYQLNGSGGYIEVNATSSVIRSSAGAVTEDEDTTSRLSGPLAFVSGFVDEVDGIMLNSVNVDNSPAEETEFLWSITIRSGDVVDTDFIDLRCYHATAALESYSITPRITVTVGSAIAPLAAHHMKQMAGA